MMKYEFETITGIEVTDEMYDVIEKMYIASDMDKRDFVKMLNLKAIAKPKEKTIVRIGVTRAFSGSIIGFEAELLDIDIATGKAKIKRTSENKSDGWLICDYWEKDCIIK